MKPQALKIFVLKNSTPNRNSSHSYTLTWFAAGMEGNK